ncbi:hypothetical protein LTR85_003482 [Meristemomyces frigidus]|nr:hypothetical protein LTR85_003482 [Meristemomyces frigidus]
MSREHQSAAPSRKRNREEEVDGNTRPTSRRRLSSSASTTSANSGGAHSDTTVEFAQVSTAQDEPAHDAAAQDAAAQDVAAQGVTAQNVAAQGVPSQGNVAQDVTAPHAIAHGSAQDEPLPTPQPRNKPDPMPVKAGQRWTQEQDNLLVRMRRQNTPYAEIAKMLGKTHLACRLHMHNLGQRAKHEEELRMIQYYRENPGAPHGGPVVGSSNHFDHQFGSDQMRPGLGTFRPGSVGRMQYPVQEVPRPSRDGSLSYRPLLPAPSQRRSMDVDEHDRMVMEVLEHETGSYWHRAASNLGYTPARLREYYENDILPRMSQQSFSEQRPSQVESYGRESYPSQQERVSSPHVSYRRQLPTPPRQHVRAAIPSWQDRYEYPARIDTLYVSSRSSTSRAGLMTACSVGDSRLRGLGEAAYRRSRAELEDVSPRTETAPAHARVAMRSSRPDRYHSSPDQLPEDAQDDIDILSPPHARGPQPPLHRAGSLSPRTRTAPARHVYMGPPAPRVLTSTTPTSESRVLQVVDADAEADVRQERTEAWLDEHRANSAVPEKRQTQNAAELRLDKFRVNSAAPAERQTRKPEGPRDDEHRVNSAVPAERQTQKADGPRQDSTTEIEMRRVTVASLTNP